MGFRSKFRIIHELFQTLVDFPFPISILKWLRSKYLPLRILFQPWDGEDAASTLKKEEDIQYLPIKIRKRRQSSFLMSLHAIFLRRAWLKLECLGSQAPPPKPLGNVSFSQTTQHIFFSPCFVSHQNLVRTNWIRFQRLTWSSKQVITKVGMAERTAWSMVAFPAMERKRVEYLKAFCCIKSTMEVNIYFFLPKCSGNLSYLPTMPSFSILSCYSHSNLWWSFYWERYRRFNHIDHLSRSFLITL